MLNSVSYNFISPQYIKFWVHTICPWNKLLLNDSVLIFFDPLEIGFNIEYDKFNEIIHLWFLRDIMLGLSFYSYCLKIILRTWVRAFRPRIPYPSPCFFNWHEPLFLIYPFKGRLCYWLWYHRPKVVVMRGCWCGRNLHGCGVGSSLNVYEALSDMGQACPWGRTSGQNCSPGTRPFWCGPLRSSASVKLILQVIIKTSLSR